ncbi:glycosyltransferase [Roseateles sp.]|uniref:glycosyltransferase n=1 Tax=Roseateles sp. TaxID=1971397 RepID=UPI003BA48B96
MTSNASTMVSIIVCCHNSEKRIDEALKSIFNQSVSTNVEVIVVDNNCSDSTVTRAKTIASQFCRTIAVVTEQKPGLLYARQSGVLAAKGTLCCFVDDDNLLDADYVARAIEIFNMHPGVGYFGGASRLPLNLKAPSWITPKLLLSYAVGRQYEHNGQLNSTTPLLWGAGLCVRTEAIKKILYNINNFKCLGRIGGKQLAGDDSEICYRLALEGWHGYYDDSLTLTHAIDPIRFTNERLQAMHTGFGAAKPVLDALEADLAKIQNYNSFRLRSLLYHPLLRVFVYATLTVLWSIRSFSLNATPKMRANYYKAAFLSSIRISRSDN